MLDFFHTKALLIDWLILKRKEEKEREKEKHRFVVPFIDAFIGCFLHVPSPELEPAALVYGDDALSNWANQPGPH